MAYKEIEDLSIINIRLKALSERIGAMEEFKKQIISTLNKLANSIIELKQKREKYEEVLAEIEKLKGRLEIVNDFKEQLSEATRTFSEEIGELRTMILDREKSFSKIELGFEKINEIVKEIEPSVISRELEKKEAKILQLESKIDKLEGLYDELTKRTEEVRSFLEKIKSFENLIELSKKIKKYIGEIEESKRYVDRVSGKVEAIFEDVNEKVLDLDEKSRKIDKINELMNELVPTIDKLQIAVENKADKRDVESLKKVGVTGVLRDKIENMEKEIEEVKKLREHLGEIANLKKQVEFLNPEEAKRKEEIKSKITSLKEEMKQIEKAFENKEIGEEEFAKAMKEKEAKINELNSELEKLKSFSLPEKIKSIEKEIEFIRGKLKEENIENLMKQIDNLKNQVELIREFKEKVDLLKPKSLTELLSEKEKISEELKLLSDQYRRGDLDQKTFESLFGKKQRELIQITSLIREKEKHSSIIEEIKKVRNSLADINKMISIIRQNFEKIEKLREELKEIKKEKEEGTKIKETLDSLKIYELPENIKEIKENIKEVSKHLEKELEFIQITSLLLYVEDVSMVMNYIQKIKSLVAELESIGKWNEEKENYLKGLYKHLVEKYKDNKEIRDLYLSLI